MAGWKSLFRINVSDTGLEHTVTKVTRRGFVSIHSSGCRTWLVCGEDVFGLSVLYWRFPVSSPSPVMAHASLECLFRGCVSLLIYATPHIFVGDRVPASCHCLHLLPGT